MSIDPQTYTNKFSKAFEHVAQDVSHLRTGRASVQLLDGVTVEAYGTRMKLQELANISVPDTNLLVVSPWDKNLLSDIEKGIIASQINLSPVVDGEIVRIPVPALTQERRQEMVKLLQQKLESGRVMMRSIRSEAKKEIEAQKGEVGISEDDIEQDLEVLQEKTAHFIEKIDQLGKAKEQELLSI